MNTYELLGQVIKITIDTGVGFTISQTRDCDSELNAKLLFNQLRQQQWDEVERFARKNYEEGFDDKKKRNPMRSWHPSSIK